MNPPSYMAYALIGGVMIVSLLCPLILGFADAWFVPLAVIPFGAVYALFDARLRRAEEAAGPDGTAH